MIDEIEQDILEPSSKDKIKEKNPAKEVKVAKPAKEAAKPSIADVVAKTLAKAKM